MAGGTTAPTVQLEGTEDGGLSYYNLAGTTLSATLNATTFQLQASILPKAVRVRVTTAGTGSILNYVEIKALGR